MTDFLLELRQEEVPARMQARAREDLARLFAAELERAGLRADELVAYSTPRRLALIARGLPDTTAATREELKGPRVGAPEQALAGFLRKTGLAREQLVERDGVLFAVSERPGRPTGEVLGEAVAALVRGFPWPKSMRWGEASRDPAALRWVRPLQGIVAIFGTELVPVEVAGIASSYATVGHRIHHPGPITLGGAHDYVEKLRACHVIVDQAEREALIRARAAALAGEAGLALVADEGLVIENAGLTEWPVPLLGRFDRAFLAVPPEIIRLTMRTNQKYFACTDAGGALADAFVCTANLEAADGGAAIVAGNARVLAARLADAKFFWEADRKVPLAQQAEKLRAIVFHEKLGTVADKVERVAKLARWLCEEGIVAGDAALAERAARLCKADLVTGTVQGFPELQGIIGGHLAHAQGEPREVSEAIRDHYKPVGQGDEVPTAPVTVAVSLADKLDTLASFFIIGEPPTGSRDPFALRRAALGVVALIVENGLRFRTGGVLADHMLFISSPAAVQHSPAVNSLKAFIIERVAVQQREAGVRHDLVAAVGGQPGSDDLVHLLARVRALQSFIETGAGRDLHAAYKRAANILRKEGWERGTPDQLGDDDVGKPSPLPYASRLSPSAEGEGEERALAEALDRTGPEAAAAVEREDLAAAMGALAALRGPIDAFFEHVTVNDPDPPTRARRLALLARFRDAVHRVADFSKIEG